MILKLLTGGIDLPKLVSSLELALAKKYEETNAALADHIIKANELIASRALAEDVETLKQRLERAEWDGIRDANNGIKSLSAQVASLTKQVEALTVAKLSEVKARKASKK